MASTDKVSASGLLEKYKKYTSSRKTYQNEQKEFQKLMEDVKEKKIMESFCEKSEQILKSVDNESKIDDHDTLTDMLLLLLNLSDSESEAAEIISKERTFLVELVERLIKWNGKTENVDLLEIILTILHNVSMYDDNLQRMRAVNCITAIKPYLSFDNDVIRLLSLATVADLATEEDSTWLKIGSKVCDVEFLMTTIQTAMSQDGRTEDGWSVVELTRVIHKLANNDCNKRSLVQIDAVPVLVKVCKRKRKEEQIEAVNALWTLSFDEENKSDMLKMVQWEVQDTLQKLSKSTDERIKNICISTLWNLNKYRIGDPNKKTKLNISSGSQIMVSYSWKHQETVKEIVRVLRNNGCCVWMDIDKMYGSTIESMAMAVEQSDIFIMCYSEKYKNSSYCRAEAEYAFHRKKTIVPVKMEEPYSPDGWLGIIIGTKLYYNFSGRVNFEQAMENLISGVSKHMEEVEDRQKNNETPPVTQMLRYSPRKVCMLLLGVMVFLPIITTIMKTVFNPMHVYVHIGNQENTT